MSGVIAVTGATGNLGGRVARLLADAGATQRLIVRDPFRAPDVGAAVVPVADYAETAQLQAGLVGAETLFFVSAAESRTRVAEHYSVIEAAVAAGVERIVYTSFLGASPQATFTLARDHAATETLIRETELRFTFLRNSLYTDFTPFLVVVDGVIRGPAGEGRASFVSQDDIARCAAAVLLDTEGAHDGQTYDLTGPEPVSLTELATRLSRLAGREIRYGEETVDEAWASRRAGGAEDWLIEGWVASYEAIAAGELAAVSGNVLALSGRRPEPLERVFQLHPELLAPLRAD